MAESENVYVKIGERGRLIERIAAREIDHATLRAHGWVLKGTKGAPTKKDETAGKPVTSGLTEATPTSVRAFADSAEAENMSGKRSTPTATGAGSAGARADAKSQAAAS